MIGFSRKKRKDLHPPRTGLSRADLFRQALGSISARPGRTAMTMLGTVLGIGAFVAVLGLTATATGQITATFSALRATEVTITDKGKPDIEQHVWSFPDQAEQKAATINGVAKAGITWQVPGSPMDVSTQLISTTNDSDRLVISAATPGYLHTLNATISSGGLFNEFQNTNALHVAVLGKLTASQLGISSTVLNPTIFVRGIPFTVTGIINDVEHQPTALSMVFIPAKTATEIFGPPTDTNPATMFVITDLGAAKQVAGQLPVALRPDQPKLLQATPVQADLAVQNDVYAALNPIFLALAALTLLIGTVGIANTTLISVVERTREIGLRRALGARARDIQSQILTEAAFLGTIGGLIGTAIAVTIVVVFSVVLQLTAILDPITTLVAPLIGTLTGVLAGIYPAARAARIAPITALRH